MPNPHSWIARLLDADPPRAKSLVMTIFGDSIAPHGGRLWLGSLIELVAPLGLTERLVRTSVFRLVQEGWLEATREGRRSSYGLQSAARARFDRANARIYAPPGPGWDGRWTLLLAPAGSVDAPLRAAVRKELEWEGFALVAPGVLAHPGFDTAALAEILRRVDGGERLFACSAQELPGAGARPLAALVAGAWNLAGVAQAYEQFMATFAPLPALLRGAAQPPAPRDAFALRTLLVHAYRRVQLHDPRLPPDLLPQPWPGAGAYALARELYQLLWEAAEQHLMDALRREDCQAPGADAAFLARFGGLGGQ
jgi:phenylacetic acid degradation operon negative regulatory protein